MPKDEVNPDTGLCAGMLKKSTAAVLAIGSTNLLRICEGFGTKYCSNCPYSDLIPVECPMLDDVDGTVPCTSCDLICPCNRTIDYQSIKKEVLQYEQRRLGHRT